MAVAHGRFFGFFPYRTMKGFVPRRLLASVKRNIIKGMMKHLIDKEDLFSDVEIETINRCNGSCAFCPVSSRVDKRPFAKMEESLFRKIVDELGSIAYSGLLGLSSNNEPFLDKNIVPRIAYARRKCQKAFIYLYTNGTLLNTGNLIQTIDAGANAITIDNYNDNMVLNKNIAEIVRDLENSQYDQYRSRIEICIRKQTEVLTNRGGTAPNKSVTEYKEYRFFESAGCLLPFRQIVVRPTGEISLCCQDALGQITLGNAEREDLKDIWFGPSFKEIRWQLLENGRKSLKVCNQCDVVSPLAFYRDDLKQLSCFKLRSYFTSQGIF